MLVDLSLTGALVALIGEDRAATRARLRYIAAGARLQRLTTPERAETYAWAVATEAAPRPQLVVDVTGGAPDWDRAVRDLTRLAPSTREEPASQRAGTITLVGAGPGDPGLHTVAAREALAAADIVLLDRLAGHDQRADLRDLAPAARIVDVGKTPGHHRMPQGEIERVMVTEAIGGAHVVRLKGGDPFVFGRGGEEVAAASAAGIPVTVIPGISSAVAAPAAAGIPVTHRETSRAFTVVSGHDPITADMAASLAALDATIVLLMGMGTLPQSVAELRRAGLPGDTPAAVVQDGCTRRQRQLVTTLDRLVGEVHAHGLSNPSVVVIGAVAALGHGHDVPAPAARTETPYTETRSTEARSSEAPSTDDLENAR